MDTILLINHAHLSRLDLNLLVAFDALLAEGSVTRAAERVGIGQPSMSHALARLRRLLKDELFVRAPEGMEPTPRAVALAEPIRIMLAAIQEMLLQEEGFDPAEAEHRAAVTSRALKVAPASPLTSKFTTVSPRSPAMRTATSS